MSSVSFSITFSTTSCALDVEDFCLLGDLLLHQWRADETGADDMSTHVVGGPFFGHGAAQPKKAGFAVTYGALSTEASFEWTEPV